MKECVMKLTYDFIQVASVVIPVAIAWLHPRVTWPLLLCEVVAVPDYTLLLSINSNILHSQHKVTIVLIF